VGLTGYVVRRLIQLVPIVLGVTALVFFLIHLVPGDPARTILGNHATAAKVALLHKEWGLDKPLPVQYWRFLGRMLHGDLGSSLFYSVPAGRLVWQRLPPTLCCPTVPQRCTTRWKPFLSGATMVRLPLTVKYQRAKQDSTKLSAQFASAAGAETPMPGSIPSR
jgi:hypothetical protein